MAKSSLSDMLSQLSLNNEEEDNLNFYLTTLRRKGRLQYFFSSTALFIPEMSKNGWIYLELGKVAGKFVWGCSICENLETFREIQGSNKPIKDSCIHAQVAFMMVSKDAFMMVSKDDIEKKYEEENEVIEVLSENPYFAVAHVGKSPSLIFFPKLSKAPNCSAHPGAHKARKNKCEHLVAHMNHFKEQEANENAFNKDVNTRSKATAADNIAKKKLKSKVSTEKGGFKEDRRERNPYKIKVNLIAGKCDQEKYNNPQTSFPTNLLPDPENRVCQEHSNKFCSKESALQRYLITSDNVHIHDLLPVDDARNAFCRVFYLDTALPGSDTPLCDCQLPYTGEQDHLLPVTRSGKHAQSSKGNSPKLG